MKKIDKCHNVAALQEEAMIIVRILFHSGSYGDKEFLIMLEKISYIYQRISTILRLSKLQTYPHNESEALVKSAGR
ncbi:hypothetical protein [Aneurinibacillus terranovensis]|uniref:hypothetical protein n=1 Tax=Aneurinibacillus terranovensis TaxID=278991 RepID=UPI0012DC2256|nr:hypothetical protein [Aneurinibacillus terranovensis]